MPAEQVRDAAAHVERYFSQALPLHVADEEESVFPRLLKQNKAFANVVGELHREHQSHEPAVDRLVCLCRSIKEDPARLVELRNSLAGVITGLQRGFMAHLHEEETLIFPALETLSQDEQNALLAEFHARRS